MVNSSSAPLLPRDPSLPGPPCANDQMYRVLVETSHDLIWSVDAQGRWIFLNHAAQRFYGYEPQEMLGRSFMEFQTAEQAQRDLAVFAQIKAGTPYFNYETQHLRKDGTPVWLSFNAVVWRDDAGNVIGTTGTARDITARRTSEETLRLVDAALESVADALFITSREGVIRYVNPAFTALTGYTAAEAIGRKPSLVCSGVHDSAFYERLWQTVLGDQVWRGQITNRHKDGHLFVVQQTISPVRDARGAVTHFVSIQQDVTERRKVEEELRWRTTLLEAQIDSALDGILVVDRAGRKLLQNQRVVELWKIPRAIAEDKDDSRQVAYCTGRTQLLAQKPRKFPQQCRILPAPFDQRRFPFTSQSINSTMPTYLFTYHGGEFPPELSPAVTAAWTTWLDGLGADMIDRGGPLRPPRTVGAGGTVLNHNGPNEVTGYSIIRAGSLDAAVAIARNGPQTRPPHRDGTIAVAELIEM